MGEAALFGIGCRQKGVQIKFKFVVGLCRVGIRGLACATGRRWGRIRLRLGRFLGFGRVLVCTMLRLVDHYGLQKDVQIVMEVMGGGVLRWAGSGRGRRLRRSLRLAFVSGLRLLVRGRRRLAQQGLKFVGNDRLRHGSGGQQIVQIRRILMGGRARALGGTFRCRACCAVQTAEHLIHGIVGVFRRGGSIFMRAGLGRNIQ